MSCWSKKATFVAWLIFLFCALCLQCCGQLRCVWCKQQLSKSQSQCRLCSPPWNWRWRVNNPGVTLGLTFESCSCDSSFVISWFLFLGKTIPCGRYFVIFTQGVFFAIISWSWTFWEFENECAKAMFLFFYYTNATPHRYVWMATPSQTKRSQLL